MGRNFLQPKKRGRPPTGLGTPVQVRLHNDLLRAVDQWMREHEVRSRPEAVRQLVQLALAAAPPARRRSRGKRPDELNASNDD